MGTIALLPNDSNICASKLDMLLVNLLSVVIREDKEGALYMINYNYIMANKQKIHILLIP